MTRRALMRPRRSPAANGISWSTLGLLLNVVVHSAAMQDRDGALLVLNRCTRRFFPFIKFIFADAGYRGQKTAAAKAIDPAPTPKFVFSRRGSGAAQIL